MEDLARAAGLSKSSIYHHVQGKEQLLRLALDRALDGLFAVLASRARPRAGGGPAGPRDPAAPSGCCSTELPYVTLLLRVRGNTATELAALAAAAGVRPPGRRPGAAAAARRARCAPDVERRWPPG